MNLQVFLKPQLDQPSQEEEPPSQLSYSTMAKQIDDEEELLSQQQALFEQPKHIAHSNKNTPYNSEPYLKVSKTKGFGSQHGGFKVYSKFAEEMGIQSPSSIPSQVKKLANMNAIENPLLPVNLQEDSAFQHHVNQAEKLLLVNQDQNTNYKPKVLGQRMVKSTIMNENAQVDEEIGPIDEQSVVLPQVGQDESIPHFVAASFTTSGDSSTGELQQNNIVITVTQSKCNNNQFFNQKIVQKKGHNDAEGVQCLSSLPHEQVELNRLQSSRNQPKNNQIQQQPQNIYSPKQNTQSHCKITKSKVLVHDNAERDSPIDNQKPEGYQKKTYRVEVPNHMKSTYDPINRKSEYKMANGGNLSEAGKRDSKVQIKKVLEPQLSDETQSQAVKFEKLKYEKAVIAGLENIQKDMALISENVPKNQEKIVHRKEQLEDFQYRKPTMKRIETMKGLAPQQLFNGFSSVETNQRQHRQHQIRNKSPEYSSLIFEQIQNLKKKINYLQKVSSRRELSREECKVYGVNRDRNSSSRNKRISINYKDYNQTSLAKAFNKKSFSHRKELSSELTMSEEEFTELQRLTTVLKVFPRPDNTPEELAKLSLQIFQKFGMQLSKFSSIDVTKFREGVQFQLQEDLTLIWFYDGLLYLGQTMNRRHGYAQMEGQGFLIQPNHSCYKGLFCKNKKSGFGLSWNIKGQKYKGEWRNDLFHGKGKLVNQVSEYEGYFARGLKEGLGYQMFANGDSYEGEYQSGKFHGRGRYVWKNKTQYVGDFKTGFMEGEGVWKSKKDTYEGQYYRNMKHGYGVYRWGNGRVYQGKFEHGQRVSKTIHTKPTIAVEKQITYDLEMQENESELYEQKVYNDPRAGKRRFTIQSLVDVPKQRGRGSRFTLFKS